MTELRPRIFIDCAFVDFAKQPTGIPRVVLKYIETGYAWGRRNGVEVIPVVATADSLVICRPLPGADPPLPLKDKVRGTHTRPIQIKAIAGGKWLTRYLKNIMHHLLNLSAALLPVPPIKWTANWIDSELEKLCRVVEQTTLEDLHPIRYVPRKGDILLAPAYWHDVDPNIYDSLNSKGMIVVILVHDLIPIAYEHFYPSPWRYLFKDNVTKAFGYASAFFCVSQFTQKMLLEFSHRQKARSVPMVTAYNGFEPLVDDALAAQLKQRGNENPLLGNERLYTLLERSPLIMVGSVEPKKGHAPVVKCLEAMWSAGFERPLLIIGQTGWMERDVVAAIQESFFCGKKLFWFSDIDDYDLTMSYLHCHALIFSSLAEGFGIPMIEASYYGKPTIALDTPIVREILGERALLFGSAAEFVQNVADLENEVNYRQACARAESLRWPAWEDYTPAVFDSLARFAETGGELPAQIAISSSRALSIVPTTPPVAA